MLRRGGQLVHGEYLAPGYWSHRWACQLDTAYFFGETRKSRKIRKKIRKQCKTQGFYVFLRIFRFFGIRKSRKIRKKTNKPCVSQCFLVFLRIFRLFRVSLRKYAASRWPAPSSSGETSGGFSWGILRAGLRGILPAILPRDSPRSPGEGFPQERPTLKDH